MFPPLSCPLLCEFSLPCAHLLLLCLFHSFALSTGLFCSDTGLFCEHVVAFCGNDLYCVAGLLKVCHDSSSYTRVTLHITCVATCMTRSYVWHDSFICVTWLVHMWDMTRSYAWHESFICFTWLVHVCDMTHWYVWHDAFICWTWLVYTCDRAHWYVWQDSLMCVCLWLIHICDIIHSYVCVCVCVCLCVLQDSFTCVKQSIHTCDIIRVTWLVYTCDMTPLYVWHDSFVCVTWIIICVTWIIHMCDMTAIYVWRNSFMCMAKRWTRIIRTRRALALNSSFSRVLWNGSSCR